MFDLPAPFGPTRTFRSSRSSRNARRLRKLSASMKVSRTGEAYDLALQRNRPRATRMWLRLVRQVERQSARVIPNRRLDSERTPISLPARTAARARPAQEPRRSRRPLAAGAAARGLAGGERPGDAGRAVDGDEAAASCAWSSLPEGQKDAAKLRGNAPRNK